jgi:argininosuccinate lyase
VDSDEDIHTAVERRVTELAGDAGAKLHTGRSRNDQVATDLRLWVKGELTEVVRLVLDLQDVLAAAPMRGRRRLPARLHPSPTGATRPPGPPPARPTRGRSHATSTACSTPDGGPTSRRWAPAPSPVRRLPLDPAGTAADLGFADVFDNSLDATSDRDFVAESLFALAMVGIHLSRIGEEFVLWSTEEFGFVELDDAFSTGSSMLPQKKNPDIAELARGKAGRLIGNLTGSPRHLEGPPARLQQGPPGGQGATVRLGRHGALALVALDGMITTATFDVDAMAAAADSPSSVATDLAEALVVRGVPFRRAHAIVGALVRESLERGVPLVELAVAHPDLGEAARPLFEPGAAAARRTTPGGGGPAPVAAQLDLLLRQLAADRARLS